MKVKLGQAVKMLFSNSSLEMVFFEAIANALDANASEISIDISIDALNLPQTLAVKITDNGEGFTNERYTKFSHLFDVDESSHKGLGRLVYLCYFDTIKVVSYFGGNKKREFTFSENFKEEDGHIIDVPTSNHGTEFTMRGYMLQKIAKNDYLDPNYLKSKILEKFYARLFQLKSDNQNIHIHLNSTIEKHKYQATITNADILDFKTAELESSINLIDKFFLHYSIQKVEIKQSSLIAAISVDSRTVKADIIAEENVPQGYKMVFLLFSDYFNGKVDAERENLTISKTELREVQYLFRQKVAAIIEEEIPTIRKRNIATKDDLTKTYPHLSGYFGTEDIGYIARAEVLKKAQDEFFKKQKELLEASSLTEEQFEQSLEISARALTEYIVFRQLTIENLKKSTKENSEAELHRLFATMRKDGEFHKHNAAKDLYRNNAWLLDDKYMTYETILSDRDISDLIQFITKEETQTDADRPDIALVFSQDPANGKPFDIVIVELKKRGISLEENMKVETQLEKRARKLMQYYNNQIQRVWYYGIIEFNEEVELRLSGTYTELYSSGKMYYKELPVAISLNPKVTVPIGVFIWDLDAVVRDADARNSAFLSLIKSKFAE